MKHHSELLNLIAEKIGARRYIEIGVYDPTHNFNKVNVAQKIGVDPDADTNPDIVATSDVVFKVLRTLEARVDLALIDGLHHKDQVKRDLQNAWAILNPGGVIVVHDANPPTEKTTCVPRGTQREWCGDVYKAVCAISWPMNETAFFTVNMDYGCAVLRKRKQGVELCFDEREITWAEFDRERANLLQLVSVDHAKKIIDSWTSFT